MSTTLRFRARGWGVVITFQLNMPTPDSPRYFSGKGGKRGSERAHLSIRCQVKIGSEKWHYARLLNLSPEGFQIDWPRRFGNASQLRIRIPGLELLTADVRWNDEGKAGCQFVTPLSTYVFEHIVRNG